MGRTAFRARARSTPRGQRARSAWGVVLALLLAVMVAAPASAAVSVSRAEVSGSSLRIEGTATAGRDITVDGVVMGRSDSGGRFKIDRTGYTPPPDCTVDVNDGSATARVATLSGCSVSTPTPPPPSGQPAPTLLAPAQGASVTTPVTLSWSQVLEPGSINGGYNWQISTSSTFSSLVVRDSTQPSVTQDTVGGLVVGTYFWQVQAVSGDLVSSAWSPARSFTVTGSGSGALAAPVLAALPFGTQYHPMESFSFSWSAVTGASTYLVEADRDATFAAPVDIRIDNISSTSNGLKIDASLAGDWNLRVRAVGADGVTGPASNVRTFSVSYDAPIGPPPTLASPADGATSSLPILLDWNDVENPQDRGYHVQVARDPDFTDEEVLIPFRTASQVILSDLSPGTKYWRVRHAEGDSSPTTAAMTAFSAARSFTVPSGAPAMSSLWLGAPPCSNPCTDSLTSGQEIVVSVQLTAVAPDGGAVVTLTSSNPAASGTHPSSVTVPAGAAYTQFRLFAGQVSEPTQVTLTGTLGSSSASAVFTVMPTTVQRLSFCCDSTGGFDAAAHLAFTGEVPDGGAVVSLSSDSPLASPPATVTVPGGSFSAPVAIPTSRVTTATTVTISAAWNGTTVTAPLKLYPQQPPTSLVLDSSSATGTQGATGSVRIGAGQPHEVLVRLSSSHPDIASPPPEARIGYLGTAAAFFITTRSPAVSTDVTISATGAGVSLSTTLTVHPAGGPTGGTSVSGLALSPTSVTGGSATSTATVTLTGAAPAGGAAVALSSSEPAASVPASVTVPAGATSATFTVATTSVSSSTAATISAAFGGATRTAVLTVSPAPPPPALAAPTLLAPASGARWAPNTSRTFDWSEVSGAASYRLQVSTSSAFTTIALERTVAASQVALSFGTQGTRYWRVRAHDAAGGPGTWSATRSFRIKN